MRKSIIAVLLMTLTGLIQCAKSGGDSVALLSLLTSPANDAPALNASRAGLTQVSSFGSNPGALKMYTYVPANLPANAPVVLVMHGCSMSASSMVAAGWNALADEWKFLVVYPEQVSGNNPALCFNWAGEYGDPANLQRGQGENQSIKSMVDYMKANHSVDANRVFIVGFSAGGAMVPVILATWPDVFAGGGILAGVPYNCEISVQGAFDCMSPGKNRTPQNWGDRVRAAYNHTGSYPIVSIWHGTADNTVKDMNQQELVDQWTNVHGIDQVVDVAGTIAGYTHNQYQDASGKTLVETVSISGMGHAVPTDPGSGPEQCGSTGAFIEDKNVCAAYHIGKYFGLDNSDTEPPLVSLTSPANGATISGNVTVTATASDNTGVEKVELFVDGVLKGTDTTSPYSISFDATQVFNGSREIKVVASDAAANTAQAAITVTVTGGMNDTTPPVLSANPGTQTFSGGIAVELSANEPATIYYTLDGSNPTTSSSVYSAAINLSDTTTVKFMGVDTTGNQSSVSSETYTLLSYDETADGTCTTHYVAGRLDAAGYTACGTAHGYINSVTMYRFGTCWSLDASGSDCSGGGGGGDTQAPTANVTAPATGATVSGTVSITADAADNVGVTKVEFYANGQLLGSDTSAPYAFSWDTTSVANGSYAIEAKAFDAAGNTVSDNDTSVTVSNSGGGGGSCVAETTFNYYHKVAGRAYSTGNPLAPDYFAQGSDDPMSGSTWGSTTLRSTDGGSTWNVGACP